jgi:hypothetical protein
METAFGVLMLIGIVVWICVRALASSERSAARTEPAPAVRPHGREELYGPRSQPGFDRDDQAFFEGYIWGRLQERNDEQQQHDVAGGNDDGISNGNDCLDHDC